MKKFWYLMLVAFIAMGAAACEKDDTTPSDNGANESFSFIAEIDQTRVDVVADGEDWKTVWTGNDQLRVVADGNEYIFSNTAEALTTFTATGAGVGSVATASAIAISSWHGHKDNVVDSDNGKAGLRLEASYTSFPESGKVTLGVESSFFRFASNDNVHIEATEMIFAGVGSSNGYTSAVTLAPGADVWVPFYADGAAEINIAVSVDGKVVKSVEALAVEAGQIYELGVFEAEPTYIHLNPDVWTEAGAWFAAYFFNDEGGSSTATMTDEDGDGVYTCRVPVGMKSVIFCRMNPDYTEFAWNDDEHNNRVWNQTEDLYIGVEPENYYYILDWSVGVWGNKDGYVAPKATMGLVGSFQNWDVANPVAMDYAEDGWLVASGIELFKGDAFKFVEGRTWDEPNYGHEGGKLNANLDTEYTLVLSGDDIISIQTGLFDIYFNPSNKHFKYILVEEFTNRTVDITIDNRADWNPLYIHLSHNGTAITPEEGALVEGGAYAVSAEYIGETLSCYFTTTDKSTEPQNVTITKEGAKVYVVEDSSEIIPGEVSAYTVPGVHNNWDTSATPMYAAGDVCVAFNVATTEFKINGNNKWFGLASGSLSLDTWTTLSEDGSASNIVVADGVYDIYFSESRTMVCVVNAGAQMPALPEVAVTIGLVGSFQGWSETTPIAMSYSGNNWVVAKGVELYKDDEFKFIDGKSWDVNYGAESAIRAEIGKEYTLVANGQNIGVVKNGKYDVYFNTESHAFKYECVEAYDTISVNIIINNKANWSPLYIYLEYDGSAITPAQGALVEDNSYFVSGEYIGETLSCKFISGDKVSAVYSVAVTKNGATVTLEENIVKLYYKLDDSNSQQYWGSTTKIHVWNTNTSFDTTWPGNTMTSEGNYTWSIIVPSELVGKTINFLVHNGNGWQSKDSTVTIKAEGNTVTSTSLGVK